MLEVRKTIGKPEQRVDVIEKATGTVRLANSLSASAEVELNHLPLIPELIWNMRKENMK
ncbi:hypothetical protein ABE288_24965 [Bacillus salipaludis]|uniref:hypothetical protein n=1 Tax=Bacillus salipaludis TaxID=2547811 RepID=UPI003D2226E4